MPVAILDTPPIALPQEPPRKIWTRAECEALGAIGVLDYHHLELIEGELIDRVGKKRPHSNSASLILLWLIEVFGPRFVQHETPIDVAAEDNPINEPEPDLIVLTCPFTDYRTGNPQPSDIRLVVEVSDSTFGFDRSVKARLYARAGIAEYWIIDIPRRQVLVHRNPAEGQYRSVQAFAEHESVAPLAAPDSSLTVRDAFPESTAVQ
jgi:Uma2 family endonuclease